MLLGFVRVRSELRFQLRLFTGLFVRSTFVLLRTFVSIITAGSPLRLLLSFFLLLRFAFFQSFLDLVEISGPLDIYRG